MKLNKTMYGLFLLALIALTAAVIGNAGPPTTTYKMVDEYQVLEYQRRIHENETNWTTNTTAEQSAGSD